METRGSGLCLFVGGEPYSLIVTKPTNEAKFQARLTKMSGSSYMCTLDKNNRMHCECGDHHFRREYADNGLCKHCGALQNSGLLNLTWRTEC